MAAPLTRLTSTLKPFVWIVEVDQKLHPCIFFSRRLSPVERNYNVGNCELPAPCWPCRRGATGGDRTAVCSLDGLHIYKV